MELAMIGLGKMGKNMVLRLLGGGHRVVVWNRDEGPARELAAKGAIEASSVADLVSRMALPRAVWCMVPSGDATESVVADLEARLEPGDIVIDGGNSNFHDSKRRAARLAERGLHFLDAGTSGGIWGLTEGYCLMVGGPREAYDRLLPALTTLAPPDGCRHVGPSGAGHYAKMVHNGIEYGMMQAYAEGFELLAASGHDYDLGELAHLWNRGSVVRSWLLELAERALKQDPGLATVDDYVDDSGEGRWTLIESVEKAVPMPVLAASLHARFRSRQESAFSGRMLAALRKEFGGHAVKPADAAGRDNKKEVQS
jgi:6-phosphogluconate dehydrogenase